MKNFLRIFATIIVAFGLIAGSLGVATAGVAPGGEIDTDGGNGGRGGDADVGGGNNDGSIDQGNNQDQNQDGSQDQDVDQDNDNNLGQGNNLTGNAGGSVNTDCSADQPDGNLDDDDDVEDDEDAGGTGDVNSGDDSASCTVGDSSVGDSETGDSNQANAGEQDASNSNAQDFEQNGGNQANAPSADLDQDAGNEANAGDGGDGGDANNTGSISFTTEITTTLIRILNSILSGNDTIIVPDDGGDGDGDGDGDGVEPVLFDCSLAENDNGVINLNRIGIQLEAQLGLEGGVDFDADDAQLVLDACLAAEGDVIDLRTIVGLGIDLDLIDVDI